MRSYVFAEAPGLESLRLIDRPLPVPGPHDVVVGVRAVSLNYRDLLVAQSQQPGSADLGTIPVSDGAGVVLATGSNVSRVQPGDRVVASFMRDWIEGPLTPARQASSLGAAGVDGLLAEQVVLPEAALVPLPASVSFESASTLPCAGVTAWYALFEGARVVPGDTVLLVGTGGVAIWALQLAKVAGARVIITSRSHEKLARARALGADEIINTTTTPAWDDQVRALTNGEGADHVVESGGPGTFDRSVSSLRHGGSMSLMGVLSGFADHVSTFGILSKQVRVQGTYVGSRHMLERLLRAVDVNHIEPVVDRVFPFDAARSAYDFMAAGAHFGKVVIRVAEG
ncbi:MAG: NAD(P)-dependent alcohol dehydrogenase [Gemmatimonadaceae bacterium]|jgi:NADPH:quinone reductase-like Zn-dependent oxidoreductase|nr:NAD(P)-dependent alcohol dehydrogenase [Gemmatimonadaceae bacterium]